MEPIIAEKDMYAARKSARDATAAYQRDMQNYYEKDVSQCTDREEYEVDNGNEATEEPNTHVTVRPETL